MKSTLIAMIIGLFASALLAQDRGDMSASDVIAAQIKAFQSDDYGAAFEFATLGIRQKFGNSERFGIMVRRGFPMVWRTSGLRFLNTREAGGRFYQMVLVTDQNGGVHALEYQMIKTEEGWLINGVQLFDPPDVGV